MFVDLLQPVDGGDVGVVEGRERLRLALQARRLLRVAGELIGEYLESDVAVEFRIGGSVDLAHAALAEKPDDVEMRDVVADERILGLVGAARADRRVIAITNAGAVAEILEVLVGLGRRRQQRRHFSAQRGVIAAALHDQRLALRRVSLESLGEHILHELPAFGIHGNGSLPPGSRGAQPRCCPQTSARWRSLCAGPMRFREEFRGRVCYSSTLPCRQPGDP